MKKCELCSSIARMYCDSDRAILCWDCDTKVHSANFLVAKHSRTLLCHACQSPTPWTGSGPKLGPTVSVCHTCVHRTTTTAAATNNNNDADDDEDEEGDSSNEEFDTDSEDGGSSGGDGDEDDGDGGDNQVVPLSSTHLPPPPASSSSSSSSEGSPTRFSSRPTRH